MKDHPQTGNHTPKDTKEVLFCQAQKQVNKSVKQPSKLTPTQKLFEEEWHHYIEHIRRAGFAGVTADCVHLEKHIEALKNQISIIAKRLK